MIDTVFAVIIHRSTFGNKAAKEQKKKKKKYIRNASQVKYNAHTLKILNCKTLYIIADYERISL